jgi:hypothetical protein
MAIASDLSRIPLNRPNEPQSETVAQLFGGGSAGAINGTGVALTEHTGGVHQTKLTLTGVSITMTDATTAGSHGSLKLYDFPAGVIQVLGATTDLTITAAAGIGATASVVGSLGTVTTQTDNAALTSTEADIIPSTACTLTTSAGTMKGKSTATEMAAGIFDGTSTAKDLFLNFAVPDAGSTANSTLTVNGTVTFTWANHGDN